MLCKLSGCLSLNIEIKIRNNKSQALAEGQELGAIELRDAVPEGTESPLGGRQGRLGQGQRL